MGGGDNRFETACRDDHVDPALAPLLQELGLTLRELAVLWVLAAPGVTSAVVGARSPAHAEENAAIGSTTAPPDLRARVEDALRRHGS